MKHASKQTRVPTTRTTRTAGKTRMPAHQVAQSTAQMSRPAQATQQKRVAPMKTRLAFYVAVAIVVALLFVGISRVFSSSGYEPPYDWKGLDTSDEFYTYTEDGVKASLAGVDVSEHEGHIDWDEVADGGAEFAFIRIGRRGYSEGGLFEDERFEENYNGARDAGLLIGIYFFSQAVNENEAREEALYAIELLGSRSIDLPIVFDAEIVSDADARANYLDEKTLTACAKAFCETIEEHGYRAMIYGSKKDIGRMDMAELEAYPIWLAQYRNGYPDAQYDFSMWQYTNTGDIPGASTDIDLDILFLTAPMPLIENESN